MQLRKLEKDIQDKQDIDSQDPYMSLGFGLIAYRHSLYSLSMVFIVLSLLMYPVLQAYESGTGINVKSVSTKFGLSSLGNLGYSTVQCASIPFGMEKVVIQCPYGEISEIVKDGIGINEVGSTHSDACLVNDKKFGNADCSQHIKKDEVDAVFEKYCIGKANCYLTFDEKSNLIDFAVKQGDGKCADKRATFFI